MYQLNYLGKTINAYLDAFCFQDDSNKDWCNSNILSYNKGSLIMSCQQFPSDSPPPTFRAGPFTTLAECEQGCGCSGPCDGETPCPEGCCCVQGQCVPNPEPGQPCQCGGPCEGELMCSEGCYCVNGECSETMPCNTCDIFWVPDLYLQRGCIPGPEEYGAAAGTDVGNGCVVSVGLITCGLCADWYLNPDDPTFGKAFGSASYTCTAGCPEEEAP